MAQMSYNNNEQDTETLSKMASLSVNQCQGAIEEDKRAHFFNRVSSFTATLNKRMNDLFHVQHTTFKSLK